MGLVITDSTPVPGLLPGFTQPGFELPAGFQGPADYRGVAQPFPEHLIKDVSSLQAMIQERESRGWTHRVIARNAGLKSKNQRSTLFCWVNSPTYCAEYVRILQGLPHVPLSPASAGAPIQNYRNRGGYGRIALEWFGKNGLVPTEHWPDNAIDPRYMTPENKARALHYRTSEWWVFRQRDLRAVASCVVGLGIPVSVGLNWWEHQVSYVGFKFRNGVLVPIFRNSYGDEWEDDGYAELEGDRALPDDAVAPAVVLAS